MIWYLDTSAALKLVVEEEESQRLATWLDESGDKIVSSMLLLTELRCVAERRAAGTGDPVSQVLDAMTLIDVLREDILRAGTSAWGLRSADALHLACALRAEVDGVVTYDVELATAARRAGLLVHQP